MYLEFILLGVFAASCEKEDVGVNKTSAELLTQKTWRLVGHGYDDNNNKVIDPIEENIQDCEKDNVYTFNLNGSGVFEEKTLNCGNGVPDHTFTWQFTHGEKKLDFLFGIVNIHKLDENELVLYNDETSANGQTTRYFNIYRH